MASYRVTGMSAAQVKELQTALGVKADGAWGKQSQAALERAYGSNADARSVYLAGGGSSTYGKTGGFSLGGRSWTSTSTASAGSSIKRANASGGSSRSTTYGNGSYGGKYLGSRQTNAYQNMENAPGSTGYERGSLTLRVPRKDDEGEIYYEDVTREGVLPLGTSFTATGTALADAQGVPDSSGIFAYAKGRTPGYIQHASGYTGMGYQDAKGNFYDANGNFIREDNFYYEPGAQISRNGMYQNMGSGMRHAGYGMWGAPGNYIAVQGANYGSAPGTPLETFSSGGGTGQRAETAERATHANAAAEAAVSQTAAKPAGSSEYEEMFAEELRRYLEQLSGGY